MRKILLTGLLLTATYATSMAACLTTDTRSASSGCTATAFDSSYSDRAAQIAKGDLLEPFTIGRPVTGTAEANPQTTTFTTATPTAPTTVSATSVTLTDGSVVSTTRPILSSTAVSFASADTISTTELSAASLSTRTAVETVTAGAISSVTVVSAPIAR